MKKKFIRACAVIQAAAISLLFMNSTASSYSSYADSYDDKTTPIIIDAVEVPSDGGINEIIYLDENGNEISFDLVPNVQTADCMMSYYNLYDDNRVSSVKDQGKEGLCWAFAGMSAVESNLITQGLEPSDIDLSEKYIAWFSFGAGPSDTNDPLYRDIWNELGTSAYNQGGNIYNVAELLARGSGPVPEALVPQSTQTALTEDMRYLSLYQLKSLEIYDPSDITSIKNSIISNGAAFLSFYSNNTYLNSDTYGYYCPAKVSTNHGVSIVGWDDSFSKNNFTETPPADGAWIVKNSWGTDWGDNGLFYLSYYDATIYTIGSFTMEDNGDIDSIYQYDGNTSSIAREPNYGVTGANIFTADSDEILKAVSFWTIEAEVPYNIKIYMDIPEGGTPSDGTLVYSQSGYETYTGYHKIDLDTDIGLDKGCRYAVVVDLMKTNTYMRLDSYASGTGVSFYSPYSSSYDWKDAAIEKTKNVCIKAFTSERFGAGIHIDKYTFPDNTFRMIVSQYDIDNNSYLSDAEISSVKTLYIYNKGIGNLKGIEYFTELTALNCSNNALNELDLTQNKKLQALNCAANSLTKLDLSENPELYLLYCTDNQINGLDLSYNPEITLLVCSSNKLTELDVSCLPKLQTFYCSFNWIKELDLSANHELTSVYCNNAQISVLDASGCTKLQTLHCYTNQICSIDLSGTASLTELKCYENQLSELDLSDCTALQTLNCSFNSLQKLDLTNNSSISYIECSDNKLTELLLPDIEEIDTLYCNNNELVFLNLKNTEVSYFSIENNISNIGNVISEFDLGSFDGFDSSNVIRYSGAAFDAEKNVFTDFEQLTVTYYYYCGQGKYATFTLQADSFMTIEECIDYVNSIDLSEPYAELSDEQLEAIECVLEYDYKS